MQYGIAACDTLEAQGESTDEQWTLLYQIIVLSYVIYHCEVISLKTHALICLLVYYTLLTKSLACK